MIRALTLMELSTIKKIKKDIKVLNQQIKKIHNRIKKKLDDEKVDETCQASQTCEIMEDLRL